MVFIVSEMSSQNFFFSLTVADVDAALKFYTEAFQAEVTFRLGMPDGSTGHAEFMIGETMIYISTSSEEWQAAPFGQGQVAPCLFIFDVEDVDQAHGRALAAGASEVEKPTDQFWGMRTALIVDPFGYRWNQRKVLEEISKEEFKARAAAMMAGGEPSA